MLTYADLQRRPSDFLSLTGLTVTEFDALLPQWSETWAIYAENYYFSAAGRHPILHDDTAKLLFILVYYKIYPIQSVQGRLFGISQGQVSQWIRLLSDVLRLTLGSLDCLPERNPARLSVVIEQFPTLSCILDGVERPVQRATDPDVRDDHYSGKKTLYD